MPGDLPGGWGTMKWSPHTHKTIGCEQQPPLEGGERGVTKEQFENDPSAFTAIPWNQMVLPDVYP